MFVEFLIEYKKKDAMKFFRTNKKMKDFDVFPKIGNDFCQKPLEQLLGVIALQR